LQRSALWFTICPTLELGFLCVGLLGACFFAVPPFSGARSESPQQAPCCQHVMLICWLFFNFVTLFDFGCCSLSQEMSFVPHYLPYFRQWLITHWLSVCLPFQSMFTESLHGDLILALLPSSGVLRAPCPLCCVFLFSSLFIIQVFFVGRRGQSAQEAMLVYSGVVCGNTACCLFAHLLVCCMPPKQIWSQCVLAWEPSCFLSVTWHREALYRLGVQHVEAQFLLVLFFCQVWLQCLSKVFCSWCSNCLFLCPSCHLGSSLQFLRYYNELPRKKGNFSVFVR
jgi:hypothetical protein